MVKILKEGQLPAERIYRTTCGKCGTHYEFTKGEARSASSQRDGYWVSVDCPLPGCGQACFVDPDAYVSAPPRQGGSGQWSR